MSNTGSNDTYYSSSDDVTTAAILRAHHVTSVPSIATLKYYVNSVVIPTLLAVGALGNTVSLAVLVCRLRPQRLRLAVRPGTSARLVGSPQPLERVAMVGLGALAVSDLAFCLVGVPGGLLALMGAQNDDGTSTSIVVQGYKAYRSALHNAFLFSSTWITVFIAFERFFAVVMPLRARLFLKAKHGLVFSVAIFVIAAIISSPLFFRFRFVNVNCTSGECTLIEPTSLFLDAGFRSAYIVVWTTLGTFVPLLSLGVSCIGLAVVLYRSRARGIASPTRYPCLRVTATVTIIVVTYVGLVCPSMLLETIWLFKARWPSTNVTSSSSTSSPSFGGATYMTALIITNLTQAVWFSGNFLIYFGCSIRRHFRLGRQPTGPATWRLVEIRRVNTGDSSMKRRNMSTSR